MNAVCFDNVSAKLNRFLLSDINFKLPVGYICGIAGNNGAGKTSLLKLLMDRKTTYKGSICITDRHGNAFEVKENREAALDNVGFITDNHHYIKEFTIEQNVDLFSPFYSCFDRKLLIEKLKQYNINPLKKISNLSKGECVQFQFAFAIEYKPSLYLFDEATAGMDIVYRKDFFKELGTLMIDGKVTVMLTTHLQEELENDVDYICILENGNMVSFSENVI